MSKSLPQSRSWPRPLPGLTSGGLAGKVFSGSAWTLLGFGGAQILRFGSNVVLARLLFPEAFGLMLIVTTIIMGLEMFSDTGVRAFLVKDKRGEDDRVLATAFTVNAIKGVLLWGFAAAMAYPASVYFQKPEIAVLLPVAAANSIFLGLRSTKIVLANRKLNLKRLMLMNLGAQAVAVAVMIAWAFAAPSVWALVAGTLVNPALVMLASHLAFPGRRDRFGWDKTAAWEIFRFGRWIFLSTIMAFLAGRGDVLIMGRLLTATDLGVFAIAINLARIAGHVLTQLSNNVLFPAYSEVFRDRPQQLQRTLARSRIVLIGIGAATYAPLAVFGGLVVEILYDARYQDAGWMLQTLACGFGIGLIIRSYDGVLHAKGMSLQNTTLQFFQVSIKFACFIAGYYLYGLPGLIVGIAFSIWASYPILAIVLARAGVWQPRLDAAVLALAALATGLFFAFPPPGLAF